MTNKKNNATSNATSNATETPKFLTLIDAAFLEHMKAANKWEQLLFKRLRDATDYFSQPLRNKAEWDRETYAALPSKRGDKKSNDITASMDGNRNKLKAFFLAQQAKLPSLATAYFLEWTKANAKQRSTRDWDMDETQAEEIDDMLAELAKYVK
jgi:SpoVK/Ycf46/Vps4 family AAA+-type ATPase